MSFRKSLSVFLFVLATFVLAANLYAFRGVDEFLSTQPGPFLVYPTTGDIDLSGKETLEFKWELTDIARTQYFDFRLYEGRQTNESTLIYKQQYKRDNFTIEIPVSTFKAGQVYTWMLMQVFNDGTKSDKSFASFTIIKK